MPKYWSMVICRAKIGLILYKIAAKGNEWFVSSIDLQVRRVKWPYFPDLHSSTTGTIGENVKWGVSSLLDFTPYKRVKNDDRLSCVEP